MAFDTAAACRAIGFACTRPLAALAVPLFLLFALTHTAGAVTLIDCKSPAFATLMTDPGYLCDEMRSWTLAPGAMPITLRILRDSDDQRSAQFEPIIAEAAEKSLATFSQYPGPKFGNVTFAFVDPTRAAQPFYADAQKLTTGECLVRLYTGLLDAAPGDALLHFQSVIAHELFHCVQAWTWPKQFQQTSVIHGNSKKDGNWWIEGTATLMGHVVYEHPEVLLSAADQFWQGRDKPVTQHTYGNVVMFSWLWHRNPQKVFDLIAMMDTNKGELAQQNALANAVGADNLSEFVRDLVDGKIRGPGDKGTPIVVNVNDPVDQVTRSDNRTYAGTPFTVFYQDVTFLSGNYLFTVEGNRFADYKRLDIASEPWSWMPYAATEGNCADPKSYRFAGMSVGVGGGDFQEFSVRIEKLPGECAPCIAEAVYDACLMGQWRIANASIGDTVLANAAGSTSDVMVRGIAAMRARTDGTHVFGFENLAIESRPSAGQAGTFRIWLHGSIDSKWSAREGRMKLCYQDSDARILIQGLAGSSDPIPIKELVYAGGRTTQWWDYKCAGSKLEISGQADTVKFKLSMDKVGPP